mgnify:CR=1 FL=1
MSGACSADDHRFMAHALRLAERGLYTTDPNPRVGCVLVRNGQVVGEGWHRKDRKSTRLLQSRQSSSYAVLCLEKKTT